MKELYSSSNSSFSTDNYKFESDSSSIINVGSNPSNYNKESHSSKRNVKKCKQKKYSIALDMVNFKCDIDKDKFNSIINKKTFTFSNETYYIELDNYSNKTRLYLNMYKISTAINTICYIYTDYKDKKNLNNHRCKVDNELLYTQNWTEYLDELLKSIHCSIISIKNIAIAVDTPDDLLYNLCNKYCQTDLCQINNDRITIEPKKMKKNILTFEGFHIGSKSSNKFIRVYNKSNEIIKSKKDYIKDYWALNGIYEDNVYRIELELNSKNDFYLLFKSIHELTSIEKLKALFNYYVKDWIRFYKVKQKDFLNHKKEYAIKHGTEIEFINWNLIPCNQVFFKQKPSTVSYYYYDKESIRTLINKVSANCTNIPNFNIQPHVNYLYQLCNQDGFLIEYTKQKINKMKGGKQQFMQAFQDIINADNAYFE